MSRATHVHAEQVSADAGLLVATDRASALSAGIRSHARVEVRTVGDAAIAIIAGDVVKKRGLASDLAFSRSEVSVHGRLLVEGYRATLDCVFQFLDAGCDGDAYLPRVDELGHV